MRDVRTSEDRATQLLICEKLSLAICNLQIEDFFLVMTIGCHQGIQRFHVCLGIPGKNVLSSLFSRKNLPGCSNPKLMKVLVLASVWRETHCRVVSVHLTFFLN